MNVIKTIAIKIDDRLCRDIHIRLAEKGQNLQSYMASLIEQDLYPERFSQNLSEQMEKIKQSMAELAEQSARLDSLIAHLDMDDATPTQQAKHLFGKQENLSILDSLKRPLPPRAAEKKPKHRDHEVR